MRVKSALALLLLSGLASPTVAQPANPVIETVEVSSRPLRSFQIRSNETRFGPLEFMGGFEFDSPSYNFGAFSSFRFLEPGSQLMDVSDIGFWFFGRIERDEDFRPLGFSNFMLQPITGGENLGNGKGWSDAESLEIKDGSAIIGFERIHRIVAFDLDDGVVGRIRGDIDPLIPRHELRANRGFETLAYAPADSALQGALVVVSERSLTAEGNVFAAILDGPKKGVFSVKRDSGFDITDGAFMPNGDLMLLERRFTIATGAAMRLRRIETSTIAPGRVADGPVLLEADMGYQIDNMEGLDLWRAPDGALMVSIISDDNRSMFQRNLYLEFRYHGD
jgi:hypothetical protein